MTATAATVKGTSRDFFVAVLQKLGITPTAGNLDALYSVEHLEGDNQRYNPLNVVQPEPGSTAFNSVGVQSFASFDTGVDGTATLLANSHWTGVRAALKGGNEAQVLAAFKEAYTWDPNVNFPTSTAIDTTESARMVGPGAPSAQLISQISGFKIPTPFGDVNIGSDGVSIPNPVTGVENAAASAFAAVVGPVMVWVAKLGFVGLGGLLIVAGLYRASEHEQNPNGGLIEAAKSGAALAAA